MYEYWCQTPEELSIWLKILQPSHLYMEKTHDLYLVRLAWCRVLEVTHTERNYYRGSLSNTIDQTELSTKGKIHYSTTIDNTKLFSFMIMLIQMLRRRLKPISKHSIGKSKLSPSRHIYRL